VVAGLVRTAEQGVPFIGSGIFLAGTLQSTVHVVASPYEDGIIVAVRDTTRETAAQRALAESEAMFRATVDAMQEAIIVSSPESGLESDRGIAPAFRIETVNTTALAMLGVTLGDVVGRPRADLLNSLSGRRLSLLTLLDGDDAAEVVTIRRRRPTVRVTSCSGPRSSRDHAGGRGAACSGGSDGPPARRPGRCVFEEWFDWATSVDAAARVHVESLVARTS
jgi:PAS domain-containing protein